MLLGMLYLAGTLVTVQAGESHTALSLLSSSTRLALSLSLVGAFVCGDRVFVPLCRAVAHAKERKRERDTLFPR